MTHISNPEGITFDDCIQKAKDLEKTAAVLDSAGMAIRARRLRDEAQTYRLFAEEFATERKKKDV